MSILEYNGGAVIAMAGKDCVGICSDLRLGAQALTVSMDFQKVAILFYFLSIQF
jgi:20S proteasome subunit beta 3